MTMYMVRHKLLAFLKRTSEIAFLLSLVLYMTATVDRLLPTFQICTIKSNYMVGFLVLALLANIVGLVIMHHHHFIIINFQESMAGLGRGMRYTLVALGANFVLNIGMEINMTRGAAVAIFDHVKVLHYKGTIIEVLNDATYNDYQCLEVAVFSSLLLCGFALIIALIQDFIGPSA